MRRALTDGRPARREQVGGHPDWCARAHHCTAGLPGGEHASIPEVWQIEGGRMVGTRYRDRAGRDHMELRIILGLPDDETTAQAACRHLMATSLMVVRRVFGLDQQEAGR
ncbi:hypothetical protein [Catellatospora sp. NPDC049609]|uniref:hypothetical protein n=1 Tax=Catellatospora sp. NPDC049609 TaxID=3155505 RepID=UPI0034447ECE